MTAEERIEAYLFDASWDDAEAARLEDELFADAAASAPIVRDLIELADGARRLRGAETTLGATTSARALAAFEAEGKRVLRVEVPEGVTVRARLDAGVDLVVARLPLALEGVRRVDLELLDPDGASRGVRALDVDVDRERGCVWVPCAPAVAVASRATLFRLHAHRDGGAVTVHDYVGAHDERAGT